VTPFGGGNVERMKFDVLVGRTDQQGVMRFKNIGTAFENETNIKILFDALPMSNVNGQAIVYLKERTNNVSAKNEPEEIR
jgi:hypothetical protein